ncbi:P-loop containing nucleoside triphosphate hydrolase protein, partial [Ochromonadaceae sp. CCMP2298]
MLWMLLVLSILLQSREAAAEEQRNLTQAKAHPLYPDLYLLGAPKCATTSLFDLLTKHTGVCRAYEKEVHYFDSDLHYKAGPQYYADHFWKPKCHKKYIDATPNYLDSAAARARMVESFRADELPRKKFIVVLREPVARAYSWYNHLMRHCVNTIRDYTHYKVPPRGGWDVQTMCDSNHCRSLQCAAKARYVEPGQEVDFLATFEEFVNSPAFPFETGLYMRHLEGWLQHFRRDQFFIVSFETLLAHTHDVVLRLSLFLQLSPWPSSKTSSVLPHD